MEGTGDGAAKLEAAVAGAAWGPIVLEIAGAFPDAVPQLLCLAEAIAASTSAAAQPAGAAGGAVGSGASSAATGGAAAAAGAAEAAVAVPDPFAVVPDVPCLVPRGKHDVAFSESAIVLRAKSAAAGAATGPLVIPMSLVTGVFALEARQQETTVTSSAASAAAVAAATTHLIVITLGGDGATIGKKGGHKVIAFADSGANLSKGGQKTTMLLRAVATGSLKDAAALAGVVQSAPPAGAASFPARSTAAAPNIMALVRALLSSCAGRVGEVDKTLFTSTTGSVFLRCCHKVEQGFLWPLRRCLLFGTKPLMCIPHSEIRGFKVGRTGEWLQAGNYCSSARTFPHACTTRHASCTRPTHRHPTPAWLQAARGRSTWT